MGPSGLQFGALEKDVRWLEDVPSAEFAVQLDKRLSKRGARPERWFLASALAAARSIRPEPGVRGAVPSALLSLRSFVSAYELALESPDDIVPNEVVRVAAGAVKAEIDSPLHAPFRLDPPSEAPPVAKEDLIFRFLDVVRDGDPERTDAHFSWIVQDMEKESATDLLVSAGLEGVTTRVHTILGPVQVLAFLEKVDWEWAPVLLRPVARQQAIPSRRTAEYEACVHEVATRELLRVARRRAPGVRSLGEGDPQTFFRMSREWAQSDPTHRTALIGTALSKGVPLEDAAEVIGLGTTLLFLQDGLRGGGSFWDAEIAERLVARVAGGHAMRRILRLGTPGQRVLALLLAGWMPSVRESRLDPSQPEASWWLTPAGRLQSRDRESTGSNGQGLPEAERGAWVDAIGAGEANRLLPILAECLESGQSMAALTTPVAAASVRQPVRPALSVLLERSMMDDFASTRSPHRWIHLWAAALAQSLWPRKAEAERLQGSEASVRLPGGLG